MAGRWVCAWHLAHPRRPPEQGARSRGQQEATPLQLTTSCPGWGGALVSGFLTPPSAPPEQGLMGQKAENKSAFTLTSGACGQRERAALP